MKCDLYIYPPANPTSLGEVWVGRTQPTAEALAFFVPVGERALVVDRFLSYPLHVGNCETISPQMFPGKKCFACYARLHNHDPGDEDPCR